MPAPPNTGEKLYELQIYKTEYDPKFPQCAQDVFITSLAVHDGHLVVTDEERRKYHVDLATKQVVLAGAVIMPEDVVRDACREIVLREDPAFLYDLVDNCRHVAHLLSEQQLGDHAPFIERVTGISLAPDRDPSNWELVCHLEAFLKQLERLAPHHPALDMVFQSGMHLRRRLQDGERLCDKSDMYDWFGEVWSVLPPFELHRAYFEANRGRSET